MPEIGWAMANAYGGWNRRIRCRLRFASMLTCLTTSAEFYDAIHAEMPTKRQRALIRMWTKEARPDEIVMAWAEEVYTVRELIAAIHRAGADHPQVARELNRLARR